MVRVICIECKDIGYTASPQYVRCRCGGKLEAMTEENSNTVKTGGNNHENLINIAQ